MKSRLVKLAAAGLVSATLAGAAAGHEFTAAILVTGQEREARLAEAVNGFLLAADERDGHANETSDGHLGGVDVQILPLPREAAGLVSGLAGSSVGKAGVVVTLGPEPINSPEPPEISPGIVTMLPGALPQDWSEDAGPDSFVARFRSAYGSDPTAAAAQGYNVARRLDMAIRPLDGIIPQSALKAALTESEDGIEW